MSDASIGYGSKFAVSQDSGVTWAEIAEVSDITPPSSTIETVDVTHMQSPNGDREFILGLNDPGECSFEINFVPGSDSDLLLQEVRDDRELVKCRITFPNNVTWTFDGLLTGYTPAVPLADKMSATVTWKVTGSTVTGTA